MDRRTVWAILLMMVIAVAPALFLKKPAAPAGRAGGQPVRRVRHVARACRRRSAGRHGARHRALGGRFERPGSVRRCAGRRRYRPRHLAALHLRHQHQGCSAGAGRAPALRVDGAGRGAAARPDPSQGERAARSDRGAGTGHHRLPGSDVHPLDRKPRSEREDAAPAQRGAGRRAAGPDLYLRAGRLPGGGVGEGLRRRPQRRRAAGGHGPHHRQHRSEHRGEPPGPRAGHQAGRHRAHRFRQPGAGRAPGAQRPLSVGRRQVQVLRDRIARRRLQRRPGQWRHGHRAPRLREAHLRGHPAQHAAAAERRLRLHGLCRPHGV